MCGCAGVRVCECTGVRVCRCAGVQVCRCSDADLVAAGDVQPSGGIGAGYSHLLAGQGRGVLGGRRLRRAGSGR